MKGLLQENNQQKHQFKSYYCAKCCQTKPCGVLTGWNSEWKNYCCACYYEGEKDRAVEYSSLENVLESKRKEKENRVGQLQFLKDYQECKVCKGSAADAYSLYKENRLVCQPCLAKKEGGSSSPISFLGQRKWFQKRWGINLTEWLENFSRLPVNANCAKKWQNNQEHLPNKCDCLKAEAKENCLLVNENLKRRQEQLKECQCETSPKVRVDNDDYVGCEKCKVSISVASKKRVIKNRSDPRFWGISTEFKILCLGKKFYRMMEDWQRKKCREYIRRGYI